MAETRKIKSEKKKINATQHLLQDQQAQNFCCSFNQQENYNGISLCTDENLHRIELDRPSVDKSNSFVDPYFSRVR